MTQVGGSHYESMAIQPWEIIEQNGLDFWEGNIVKYVLRYRDKNGVEDLRKALHYLTYLIDRESCQESMDDRYSTVASDDQPVGLAGSGWDGSFYSSIGAVPASVDLQEEED